MAHTTFVAMPLNGGLKACIAKKTKEHEFPPPRATIEKYYTHDLDGADEGSGPGCAVE